MDDVRFLGYVYAEQSLWNTGKQQHSLQASHPNRPESLTKTYTEEKYEEQVEE